MLLAVVEDGDTPVTDSTDTFTGVAGLVELIDGDTLLIPVELINILLLLLPIAMTLSHRLQLLLLLALALGLLLLLLLLLLVLILILLIFKLLLIDTLW